MLTGRRFVIWGLSRLSVRVARALAAGNAGVTVVRLPGEAAPLQAQLGAEVRLLELRTETEAAALTRAGLAGAACLLALSEDDGENLRATVAVRALAPEVPMVLRAFDPLFADQLEQSGSVRRAYSVSALAAPAFVAAACGDAVLETLRLGDGEVPLCRLTVRGSSPLAGLTPAQVKANLGCAVMARAAVADADWQAMGEAGTDGPLTAGEGVLLGGPRDLVLAVSARNAPWAKSRQVKLRRVQRSRPVPKAARVPTRLWPIAAGLMLVLLGSVVVFQAALHLRWVDAVYFVVTLGFGDISLKNGPDWLKLFGCAVLLANGALLGILFSWLTAQATLERLEETQERRASRLSGHIIVAGLGNLGYRVARQFAELGLKVVVVDLAPRSRFAGPLRAGAVVLSGDASFPDTLERAGAASAAAFVACTNDDLANIQACLYARRLQPEMVTVARLSDDTLAEHLPQALAIDHALSASQAAAGAFVGAATDALALRPLALPGLSLLAGRVQVGDAPLTADTVADWRAAGLRVLAFRLPDGPPVAPSALPPTLPPGAALIVCGPASAVRSALNAYGTSAPARPPGVRLGSG